MPTTRTYDPNIPAIRQSDSWSCSIAATTWMLNSLGIGDAASYPSMEVLMQEAGLVSPDLGLLDGSGAVLADWLAVRYGLTAHSERDVSWEWLQEHAGTCPIAIGSGSLYHWVAVRGVDGETLTLSNPAPGYRGLYDTMTEAQFEQWAPWACVWIAVEASSEEDDPVKVTELENAIDYLKGDVADAFESAITTLEQTPKLPKAARDAVAGGLRPALDTLRRGGPPEDGG